MRVSLLFRDVVLHRWKREREREKDMKANLCIHTYPSKYQSVECVYYFKNPRHSWRGDDVELTP